MFRNLRNTFLRFWMVFCFDQLAYVQGGRCGIYGMNSPEWFTTMEVHLSDILYMLVLRMDEFNLETRQHL